MTTTIAANQSCGDGCEGGIGGVVVVAVLRDNMEIISNSDNYCMVNYCI